MIPIQERNRQILQRRREGVSGREVARQFRLSPSRIYLIERRDAADKSMAERCARVREAMCADDDPEKMWPVSDLADAIRLSVVTKKRLLHHFAQTGKGKISLRELMDMCSDFPEEKGDFRSPPLLRVCGIGKKGFWSVVNGLTNMDQGKRCNEEWRTRLIKVKRNWGI